jgi:hypothetical protein
MERECSFERTRDREGIWVIGRTEKYKASSAVIQKKELWMDMEYVAQIQTKRTNDGNKIQHSTEQGSADEEGV